MYIYFMALHFRHKLHGRISIVSLENYLKTNGIILIPFQPESPCEILQILNLVDYAKRKLAFNYVDDTYKIVFVRDGLCDGDMIFRILHELCHIKRKHTPALNVLDKKNLRAEKEANDFAHYALMPYNPKILLSVFLLLVFLVCFVFFYKENKITFNSEQPVTVVSPEPFSEITLSETVVITSGGEKYHKPGCRYVKNKTNIRTCTIAEAESARYTPCSVCFK